MVFKSPFYEHLAGAIDSLGGIYNAHLHLDRSGTLGVQPSHERSRLSTGHGTLSLKDKHALIAGIHDSAHFDPQALSVRVNRYIDAMVAAGTVRADTLVDISADGIGLSVLDTMLGVKSRRKDDIDLRIGAYSPLGFKDSEPRRWELFAEGATFADFIGSLPERDDRDVYPDHIGFEEHCGRVLSLSRDLGKPLQIHLDQQNNPLERDTERFIGSLEVCGGSAWIQDGISVWLVHAISPSRYEESRFNALVNQLVRHDVGVICCPSAALSMRQLRPLKTPTSNSIARVLDLLAAGVHVCLGSDNIADMFSPAGTPDLMDELFVLCNALRFYDVDILAKLAAGVRLGDKERTMIQNHLDKDRVACESIIASSTDHA